MRHLLSTKPLEKEDVCNLFELADKQDRHKHTEKEKAENSRYTGALLFYENSTRTRSSFELAFKDLNLNILDLKLETSSVTKGENLKDTVKTIASLGAKIFVIRHSVSRTQEELVKTLELDDKLNKISIINAGDGTNEHPTQALLDLYTLKETLGDISKLKDKKILIIGDCLHSRVARSNIYLMKKFDLDITLCGPPNLVPVEFEAAFDVKVHHKITKELKDTDFIMALRIQKERQNRSVLASLGEYSYSYGINHKNLEKAGINLKDVKILHPGPVNRDVEISSELVDDPEVSLIERQVYNGKKIRTAVIQALINHHKSL